jgi:hypothetical protein
MRRHRLRTIAGALALSLVGVAVPASGPAHAESTVEVVSGTVADANGPSISSDGRWLVYGGMSGERRSVFRTDRETGTIDELAKVPDGVRSGDTIHPRLSADGCVVVALTEIPFDLFRDDDRDERWDVYRLVLPECGGQPNGWELVSAGSATGVALDGVDTESPPTLSATGAVIAYAHPVAGGPDGLMTVTVVDVSIPPDEPGRVSRVEGTPAEAPNRAFVNRGARQPAISQNGRHLAFVADFTASDALPGWADGPVPGGEATAQVYVWDRFADDDTRRVQLVSGRDGRPSAMGGSWPSISEDGRIIAFVSRDASLVTANLPVCGEVCPTQVFRFDRDPDGNGIFDEPPRSDPLTMASAVVPEFGLPIAGDRSSWAPTVSFAGSQIAFVTDATNLMPSRRGGGGDVADGDLLVSEHHLGQLRRVIDGPDFTGVPGAHGRPALSRTGQVIAFDTMAGAALPGPGADAATTGRAVATVEVTPRLSLAALDFGTVMLGFESAEMYATVLNAGPGSFEPVVVDASPRFRITGGTCRPGIIVAAGQSCSVKLTFSPSEPRGYLGALTVAGEGEGAPSVSAELRGAAGEPTLLADPGGVDLPASVVGQPGGRVAIDISNIGFVPTRVVDLSIAGAHADDFEIVEQSCTDRALNPDASCAVELQFHPTDSGYRNALLVATAGGGSPSTNGAYTAAVLGGLGRYEPVVEVAADAELDDDGVPLARPGELLGVTGIGFPAEAEVTIGFDDGSSPFATVMSSPDGSLIARVRVPARARAGDRRLVLTSVDEAVAAIDVRVAARGRTTVPGLPGYGLG